MEKIVLKNPIEINGITVSEMTYDANEITGTLFATAEARKKGNAGGTLSITPAAEFDFALHLYLGYAAIIAVNPAYDWSDLERIKGLDISAVMRIGRNFMLGTSEAASTESDSEKPTEIMPESTTPVKQISKKSESSIL